MIARRFLNCLRHHRRDERGSALVLALVLIIVIAIAGTAVLNQVSSAPAAEHAYVATRTVQVSAEQLAESTIQGMRYTATSGMSSYANPQNPGFCSNWQSLGSAVKSDSTGTYDVYCEADKGSAALAENAPYSQDASIITLGGEGYTGSAGLPYLLSTTPYKTAGHTSGIVTGTDNGATPSASSPNFWAPFCNDFHDYQDKTSFPGADRCEAGLFVGRNAGESNSEPCATQNASGCPGGLYIKGTSTTVNPSVPLVESNSSIVLSNISNGVTRELDVAGPIWSRVDCGQGAGVNSAGFGGLASPPWDVNHAPAGIYANYDPSSPGIGNYTSLHCNNTANAWNQPVGGTFTNNDPTQGSLLTDPDYVHEPIDTSKLPIVNNSTSVANCNTIGGTAGEDLTTIKNGFPSFPRTPCSSNNCWDPTHNNNDGTYGANTANCTLNPATLCANGYAVMPAMKIMNAAGTAPLQESVAGTNLKRDVFAAWYDNAADLNSLMAACPDSLIWFRPGIYYFDFRDLTGNTKGSAATTWLAPKGCWPVTNNCTKPDEIVGGSTPYDTATGTYDTWNPCLSSTTHEPSTVKADILACTQPAREMFPESASPVNQNGWDTIAAAKDIDDQSAATSLWSGNGGNGSDGVIWGDLQTPIPQNNDGTDPAQNMKKVDSYDVQVAYSTPGDHNDVAAYTTGQLATTSPPPDATTWYKDLTTTDKYNNGGGAELKLTISGGPSCYIHLPNGLHGAELDPSHPVVGSPVKIDLINGCDPLNINNKNGDGVYVDSVGAGFPCGTAADWAAAPNSSGTTGATNGQPLPPCTTTPDTMINHPEYVNLMKGTFNVTAPATVTNKNDASLAFMNGMNFDVSWDGRPSPPFPGGCDRSLPGVQFIFGGFSTVAWGTTATHSSFNELCASRQDQFPNWDNDPACAADPNSATCYSSATAPGHNLGIAIYGMSEDSAGTPPTLALNSQNITNADTAYTYDSADSAPSSGPIWTNTDWSTPTGSNFANPDPTNGHPQQMSAIFTSQGWSQSEVAFYLPTNIVGTGANQIPPGSLITHADVTVYHREGQVIGSTPANSTTPGPCAFPVVTNAVWSTGNQGTITYTLSNPINMKVGDPVSVWNANQNGYKQAGIAIATISADKMTFSVTHTGSNPGAWTGGGVVPQPLPKVLPAGCSLSSSAGDISSVNLKISPSANVNSGSNAYASSIWSTKASNSKVNNGQGLPPCTAYSPPDANTSVGAFPSNPSNLTDYQPGPNSVSTGPSGNACPFTWGNINSTIDHPDSTGEDWSFQRDLTDDMSSPEAWAGAKVEYMVATKQNADLKEADLSGIVFNIQYRAGSPTPRPIEGCATTRTAWPNGYLVPYTSATGYKGVAQAQKGYDWLDYDWGTINSTGAKPFQTDDAYGNNSGNSSQTGGAGDAQDCALLLIDNGGGSSTKFHVSGVIYAPSAAIDMTANNNDASWATDGITVRQLSALRWQNNGNTPAVGGDPEPRTNRQFTIEVCRHSTGCTAGNIVLKEVVVIDDQAQQNIGYAVDIASSVQNQ